MRNRTLASVYTVSLSLLLASCGGDDSPVAPAAPIIQITTPTNGVTVTGLSRVTGNTGGEVAFVLFDCGDGKFVQAIGTTSWTADCDTTLLPDGSTTMKARAIGLERQEASSSVSVTVANMDPVVGTWDWQPGGNEGYAGSYIIFHRSGVYDESNGVIFASFANGWQRQGPGVITVQRLTAGPITVNTSASSDGRTLTLQWSVSGSARSAIYKRRGS